jgi:hypothetical protein
LRKEAANQRSKRQEELQLERAVQANQTLVLTSNIPLVNMTEPIQWVSGITYTTVGTIFNSQ